MYSTVLDVRNALSPGADPADYSTASSLTDAQLEDAIREADAIIDSYISAIYVIPAITETLPDGVTIITFAPYPVRYYSRNIAAWLATLTFMRNEDVGPDEPVRLRYTETLRLLVRYSTGDATLPNPPFVLVDESLGQGIKVVNQYEGKLFGPKDFSLVTYPNASSIPHDFGWNV